MSSNIFTGRSIAAHAFSLTELIVGVVISRLLIRNEILIYVVVVLRRSIDTKGLDYWIADYILLVEEASVAQVELITWIIVTRLVPCTLVLGRAA